MERLRRRRENFSRDSVPPSDPVSLLKAHRILITTAVVFFFGFAAWELRNYADTGEPWAPVRALLYFVVSVGFWLYLRSLKRWLK